MKQAQIQQATSRIIAEIAGQGRMDKATLAHLRNSFTVLSPQAQTVWPLILAALPSHELSYDGNPTKAETAVFTALHLFANYQQGSDQLRYAASYGQGEIEGITVFAALSQMRQNADDRDRLDRRVGAMLAMTNFDAVVNALSHLVDILKGNKSGAKLDFARLAQELYSFQWSFENANRVRLQWGREYYHNQPAAQANKGE